MALPQPSEALPWAAPVRRRSLRLVPGIALIGVFFTLATAHYLLAPLDRFDEGVTLTKGCLLYTSDAADE